MCSSDLPKVPRQWFYRQHGQIYGPVSSSDLRAAAYLHFIAPTDLVRQAGTSRWIAAENVEGLFASHKDEQKKHSK